MLKDNWEDKHGIKLPAHTSCSNNSDHLTGSSSKIDVATLNSSGSNSTSIEPVSLKHQFDNQYAQQNRVSETHASQSLVDSNMHELIKFLSTNYGPKKTPLEVGSPEYMKLVEILKQSSVNSGQSSVEELRVANNMQQVASASLTEDKSSTVRSNQEKVSVSEKAAEPLWEGSLQLSSSVTLSAVAFFKSGEKLVGNIWPELIEVKGKVRLEAFEKYVQDLPRSRSRGLMVVSICWNEGSSNIGLNGMKEVAKGYKKSSRVGFAHLLSGIDLYICPRSDPIITILAKYGFFKGMSVIDDKPDSMIGCVVWRKNRPSNAVGNNTLDGKNSPSLPQPQNSPPGFSSKQNAEKKPSPEKVESGQHDEPLTSPLTIACAEMDRNADNSSSSSSPVKNSVGSDSGNLLKKRSFEDDDLPEFDFGVASQKSTLISQPIKINPKLDSSQLTQLPLVVNATERNNNNSGSLTQPMKKTKLFDDDDMPEWRPPEPLNRPPPPPQITTSNLQNLPLYPPRPPLPPPLPPGKPPHAAIPSSFSYQPVRPSVSSQPPVFTRPPPQSFQPPVSSKPPVFARPPPPPPPPSHTSSSSGRLVPNQVLWHQPPFSRPQL